MTNSMESAVTHVTRRPRWARHRFTLLTVFLTLCCSQPARAQVAASIKGIVTDLSGAPVPSATVTANNTETGALRSVTTEANLIPGGVQPDMKTPTLISYSLRVQHELSPNTSLTVG
jgi:hypothetical protein